ncbi:MAG: hypothetical protein M1482_18185 [Chloroflexi bacterium]|nr:hypothetical protein [Chloroflexota bacterium]
MSEWICTHYTLLDLKNLGFPRGYTEIDESVTMVLNVKRGGDGGWNCEYWRGAVHGSLDSTLGALEGLLEFRNAGNRYRIQEIRAAEKKAIEFLLRHQLFRSHRTGAIIDPKMLRFAFPCWWHYDILRALDYLQSARALFDPRIAEALAFVRKKRRPDGKWLLPSRYKGAVHFEMEQAGAPSRWNTLRAMRVLKYFGDK